MHRSHSMIAGEDFDGEIAGRDVAGVEAYAFPTPATVCSLTVARESSQHVPPFLNLQHTVGQVKGPT